MLLASAARKATVAPGLGRRAASAIAGKYSKAVFGAALAKSPQTLTQVHTELASVAAAVAKDAQISEFVSNPTLSLHERNKGLEALFTKLETAAGKKGAYSEITKNFFTVLSENGRLYETPAVIQDFNELFSQYKGEITVTVTSASPLERNVLTRLESTLKQSQAAQAAKSVKVTNKVNPSILGGLIVDFGDKTIDLSVQSRITKLNNVLNQSV